MPDAPPDYLAPYVTAARTHRGGFGSLLWASRHTQRVRFAALTRLYDFTGKRLLDVGAGRGDLLTYLLHHRIEPADYIALEAVEELATAIEQRHSGRATILRADFLREPARLFVGADVIVFSGSLNTLPAQTLYPCLTHAWAAATHALVFNFLADPSLAAAPHLHWHRHADVEAFARSLTPQVHSLADYLDGDCTIRMLKP